MHHGYAQAEGVANLGYARYVAVCPPDWSYGTTIGPVSAALPE
jgi:hypothetical protein